VNDRSITPPEIIKAQKLLRKIEDEMKKVIVGQESIIAFLFIGLLSNGHILIEGVPGVAKTLIANTLAKVIHCECKRIQFTPDILPADVIGTQVFNAKTGNFDVKQGPVFTNILLADEINRAPSKVQSALLEVMQERQVTIGGETFPAPFPFFVIATQNPIEQEGTYPLSEAQTDRFMMKLKMNYPSREEEKMILERMGNSGPLPVVDPILKTEELSELRALVDTIYLDEKIVAYILNIVQATRNHDPKIGIDGLLEYGASPRATLALKQSAKARALLEGRNFVIPQDIKDIAYPILRHRLRLSYEAEAQNLSSDDIVNRILDATHIP
jgi:MoxR-like ATPase